MQESWPFRATQELGWRGMASWILLETGARGFVRLEQKSGPACRNLAASRPTVVSDLFPFIVPLVLVSR